MSKEIISGIYVITNIVNGKFYVGSTTNFDKRWISHKRQLKANKHHNIMLQRAYNKYGLENLVFDILEESNDDILLLEQSYLVVFVGQPDCYNIAKHSSGGDNLTNNPNREEIIEKISKGLRERYENMTEEEKKDAFSKFGEDNPNWKGENCTSKKLCKCGTTISSNNNTCKKCMITTGDKNNFYGKTHTQESIEKIKETKIKNGTNNILPTHTRKVSVEGIIYESCDEASRILNISGMSFRIKSKNPLYDNYFYVTNEKRLINAEGKVFKDHMEASRELSISRKQLIKKIKSEEFDNYFYTYEEIIDDENVIIHIG